MLNLKPDLSLPQPSSPDLSLPQPSSPLPFFSGISLALPSVLIREPAPPLLPPTSHNPPLPVIIFLRAQTSGSIFLRPQTFQPALCRRVEEPVLTLPASFSLSLSTLLVSLSSAWASSASTLRRAWRMACS
ncbi:hypothetical protein KSP39_PZI002462 [Platanthera zijinensis]|uniref:Uncharacterized protein n=1 Tax=Platanthera zijinensis TaxID=2320716 RepID=A0AAP0BYR9_9ASPA